MSKKSCRRASLESLRQRGMPVKGRVYLPAANWWPMTPSSSTKR